MIINILAICMLSLRITKYGCNVIELLKNREQLEKKHFMLQIKLQTSAPLFTTY